MSPAGITWIPYGEDAARVLADRLLARHEQDLPDLSRVDVLLPSLEAQTHFQTTLIDCAGQRGHPALLGPQISTLPLWTVSRFAPSQATPSPQVTGLMLVEALVPHQRLFGRANPWQVADALLNLFTLMSRQDTGPDETLADFETRLQQAYGGEALAPLSREARMVHTLWQAWREQLAAEGLADPQALYREALERAARHTSGTLYLVAPEALTPPEATCINRLRHEGRAEILLQGDTDSLAPVLAALEMEPTAPAPTDPAGDLVEQVFDTGETAPHLAERARRFAERVAVSPLTDRLATYAAPDAEQHARAIDVQTRLWLNEGKQHIGIVTDDRRLARRVRALLERAGLVLSDSAGWLLSTTSAAATLERWLECIEQDFSWQPLMDVLKSPFVFPATARDQALKTVYRLENDVIRHENVGRGLTRYQAALRRRAGRLPDWGHRGTQAAEALLNRLQRAAAPLVALHARPGQAVAHNYLEALQLSLERLGLARGLSEDPAGQRILETLTSMTQAAGDRDVRLDWAGFRTWLGRALEGAHFRPATQPGPVMLLSLPQARLLRFDALVLAGLDREHLPGREPAEVFFNNRVRRELGLPGWEDHLRRRQLGFRSLLESAPRVLLTWQAEDVDEPILPSPWVEAIEAFHILAYGQGLADPHLPRLSRDPRTRVGAPQPAPLPPVPVRPTPASRGEFVPESLSASRHQHLIDCPYQFFAADCLRLSPQEEVREALEKADYGELVHTCLQAFHQKVGKLPGPFAGPLDPDRRAEAIDLLTQISQAVFRQHLEDNFEHRGWLHRWLAHVPGYVDWQLKRATAWQVEDCERRANRPVGGFELTGRLDRIDAGEDGVAVVDYKTGAVPSRGEVETGEAVQLPSYALLLDHVARVEYLQVEAARNLALEGEALETLSAAVESRLKRMREQLEDGAALPAWGDADTCARCDFRGVCRRPAWGD